MALVPFIITEEDLTTKSSAFKFNEIIRRVLIEQGNISQTLEMGGGGAIFCGTETKNIANTTTETSLVPLVGSGSMTIPTADIEVGKSYRITAYGILSTLSDTSGTLNIKLYYGSTVIASTSAQSMTDGLSSRMWKVNGVITFWTIGATGTCVANCVFENSQAYLAIGEPWWWEMKTVTPVSVDTTADVVFDLTATFSIASASNIIETENFIFEELN